MTLVARFPASVSVAHDPPSTPSSTPAIAELLALRDLEIVDVASLGGVERAPASRPHAELLRLPPPPLRAPSGAALYAELGRAVARFDATESVAVRAPREQVLAEGRMIALIRGLHGLEAQIRGEMARRARA